MDDLYWRVGQVEEKKLNEEKTAAAPRRTLLDLLHR